MENSVATADEVHDFQVVSVFESSLGPLLAGYDLSVQFHRNPVGFHSQRVHQRRQRKWTGRVRKLPLFSVDLQFHE